MKKKLRIILIWAVISLVLQFGAYSALNAQVQKVLAPSVSNGPITRQLKATIPGTDLENIQISYAKDYLAYMEDGTLKVFNLQKQTIVFEKEPPSSSDGSLGVLSYQWLPDRNTLLYFYAKENPNPVTYVTVYPSKSESKTSNTQPPASTEPKTEDPHEKPDQEVPKDTQEAPAKPRIEKRYNNPQITELYTLELPDSDDDTAPDDRFNQTIDQFPAGGKIEEWVNSTTTNLMYLTIKSGSSEQLMEIDVMKNVRTLNRAGETIDNMAASDRYGTLYLDSKIGSTQHVVALNGTKRQLISPNAEDKILGIRDGLVYIGEIDNDTLVKIKTTPDLDEVESNPALQTVWEGSIPFSESLRTVIGDKGQLVIYDHQAAYIISNGQLKNVTLSGDENYVSVDGAELVKLTQEGTSTLAELEPLESKE